ncbi:MAG: hypothetical protein COC11_02915, partial [Candidatus Neomarinimicrobiota bacterium]
MRYFFFLTIFIIPIFADDCSEYNEKNNTKYNCDCNETTWQKYYSYMLNCWLPNANLRNVDLKWTNLEGAYLVGADLRYSQLVNANLTK